MSLVIHLILSKKKWIFHAFYGIVQKACIKFTTKDKKQDTWRSTCSHLATLTFHCYLGSRFACKANRNLGLRSCFASTWNVNLTSCTWLSKQKSPILVYRPQQFSTGRKETAARTVCTQSVVSDYAKLIRLITPRLLQDRWRLGTFGSRRTSPTKTEHPAKILFGPDLLRKTIKTSTTKWEQQTPKLLSKQIDPNTCNNLPCSLLLHFLHVPG